MARRSVRFIAMGLFVGLVVACGGSENQGRGALSPVPSAGPLGTTATCPPASRPDTPGPEYQARPVFTDARATAAFDWQSGRVVTVDRDGLTWTLNICSNIWEHVETPSIGSAARSGLFYDPSVDLTFAVDFANGYPLVRSFSVETSTWTRVQQRPEPWRSPWDGTEPRFVMDPTARTVYGYQPRTGEMRAYDLAANAWTEVQQGELRPPVDVDALAAFDTTVGRMVLYVMPSGTQEADDPGTAPRTGSDAYQTWTFDPRSGAWARVSSSTPVLVFGWSPSGTEMTFDAQSGRTVVLADGRVATFDAVAGVWSVPEPDAGWPSSTTMADRGYLVPQPDGSEQVVPMTAGPLARHGHGLVDDTVNGRVIVLGGEVRTSEPEWREGTDVWAYAISANRWTELVPEQPN